MVLMHTEGLVIYIQFKGVSDIRHDSQLVDIKSNTEGTMCVNCAFAHRSEKGKFIMLRLLF